VSPKIIDVTVRDIRFPTSLNMDGSDALNVGDYSATYVTLITDTGATGDGLTFTNGRGNEIVVAAVHALKHHVIGRRLSEITSDLRGFYRDLTVDKQLRWLGPEKGILHMATGALINAVWDLWAKREGKPMWKHLADLTPEQLVGAIDFTYIDDVLTSEQALELLRSREAGKEEREAEMLRDGFPAYTTSTGWLGYPDEKVRRLCRQAMSDGWTAFKMKVGANLEDNIRRAALMREEIGDQRLLMMDANQVWGVGEAITHMKALAQFDPYWIEEPTSPDDVLGHAAIQSAIAPIRVATGEVVQNRVIFKQMLQANAISFLQVDSCRMGGVNEVLAVLLMAAKFGVPVCPHAGGVGLCEYVQHLSIVDYVCVSGALDGRVVEYVDHLHEHFVDPVRIRSGRYLVPTAPGYSIEIRRESLERHRYPDGAMWAGTPAVAPARPPWI